MFKICIWDSEQILASERSLLQACVCNMCAALSTNTPHVLVFVRVFAGRGQLTSEAQGDAGPSHSAEIPLAQEKSETSREKKKEKNSLPWQT